MQGFKCFTVLGLEEVYFQIELVRENRHKTTFTIYQKKREWNAYQIWKFAGNFLFYEGRIKTIEGKGCLVYLDDMVIYGKRIEEHDKLLLEILKHLKDRGFKTNIEKIQLGNEEVKLFGFIKNRETVKMP